MFKRGMVLRLQYDWFNEIKDSIIARVILFICVMIILGGLTRYYFSAYTIHTNLFKIVSIHQEALANEAAKEITYDIDVRKTLLSRIASRMPLGLLENPNQLKRWLDELHDFNPLFSSALFVLNEQGSLIAGTGFEMVEGEKAYASDDFFKRAFSQEFVIGTLMFSQRLNEPVLPMAMPIKDDLGHVRAIVVGMTYYDATFFNRVLNGRIGKTGGFLLIDAKQQMFIAAANKGLILKPTPSKGKNLLHDKALEGFRGSGITTNTDGVEELAAIASIPNTDWFVVSRIQTKEAFVMEDNIKTTLIRAHIISLIIVPAILFLFLFFFFKPLRTSALLANKMSLGEVPLKPLPITRMDEVGYLTVAFNRLMTMLLASQKELKEIAHYDYLTKLPNRFLMVDRLEKALARCARNHTHVALLFMDLDGFKAINDSLGHSAGDHALVEVAKRFSALIRESDTLARVGGDEFVIVLSDLDNDVTCARNAATLVAVKCTEALKEPFLFQGSTKMLGVSIGMAMGDKESKVDDLMAEADTKMYQAKHGVHLTAHED